MFIYPLLLSLVSVSIGLASEEQSRPERYVQWIENAGFHVHTPSGGVLIDAILNEQDEIALAKGSFIEVKLIFVSHIHGDHFNARGVLAHLRNNKEAKVVLTPESFDQLQLAGLEEEDKLRVFISHPDENAMEQLTIDDYTLDILPFKHADVQNIGFGLKGPDLRVVYLNGGIYSEKLFQGFSKKYPENDILIANKWPLVKAKYVDLIKDFFDPTWLLMAHHSGTLDGVIQQIGSPDEMEAFMSRSGMKGRVFRSRMALEPF